MFFLPEAPPAQKEIRAISDHFNSLIVFKNFHLSATLFSHTEDSFWTDAASYVYSWKLIVYRSIYVPAHAYTQILY